MNVEVAADVTVQKLKINEHCAVDSSVCDDLQDRRAGDCNGVQLEGAVREVESENGKEDLDGAYVFINGIDTASEDSVEQNSVVRDPREDFIGDKGEVKVNGCGHRAYIEEPVTADKEIQGQHHEGVILDNGDNNSLLNVPTKEFVGNNGELEVNGCNGVGDFGVQVTEEGAIEAQPCQEVSNGSCVDEVKPETEVMNSLGKSDDPLSAIRVEDNSGGLEIIVEEQIAPEEVPESNESSDVAAPALDDRKDQQYENASEISDNVGESPGAEPEEITESPESSGVAAPAPSDKSESMENAGEVFNQVDEVPKPEPEDIPASYESSDTSAPVPAPSDRDEPLESAGDVSDQVDEVTKTESQVYESYESNDVADPILSNRKEALEKAVDASDQVPEVSKSESAIDDSISGDSELQKECDRCMDDVDDNLPIESISEPKVVGEQESEREVAKSDLVLEQLTDSAIPSLTDVPSENVSGDSDQNVQIISKSLENDESSAPYDNDHASSMSVVIQSTADATLTADEMNPDTVVYEIEVEQVGSTAETKPDTVVDEIEFGSTADISVHVQTLTKVELTPLATEAETAPSHDEAETTPSHDELDVAPSPVELEPASIIGEAESDLTLIKTEPTLIEPETDNPSAWEPLIGEVVIKSLDLGQESKEQCASTESLPSVDNGNVHDGTVDEAVSSIHADVEDKFVTVEEAHDESAEIIDNSEPAIELEKGQMVSSDMDLERADKDACLVSNDISSSSNATTGGDSEICFGSISQKELSAQPTSGRNTDDLSSAIQSPSCEQAHTNSVNKVEKRFFNHLIKIPRYDDRDNLREQINAAQPAVDEKTRIRDAIKIEREKSRALRDELFKEVDAAVKEEDAARESMNSKRQEVAHVQEMVKAAKSIDEIDAKIRSMEHTLHHVTIDLKEEKQIMRDIKQLKLSREQLSSNLGKQSLEQREQNEGRLKILRKEEELLRDNVSRAELVTKTAKKNYYNEKNRFWELVDQFKTANAVRQDAYQLLKDLKDRLRKKEERFFTYRKDQSSCFDLVEKKQIDAVSDKCIQQVEDLIKLWVEDSEFRDDYIRCNAHSTLRRLGTRDGRSLGPNEEPQKVPSYTPSNVRPPVKDISSLPLPSCLPPPPSVPVEACSAVAEPSSTKPVEWQKRPTASKANSAVKPFESHAAEPVSVREEVVEVAEEPKRTNEEEEMVRKAEELRKKAEELRKEEVAAKLKEQRRLEEKAKAEAALERKKRNAERAQARAAAKAQKEAELKEKEREKRLKKKERKNGAVSETSIDVESTPSETFAETPKEVETLAKERGGLESVTKRASKPSRHFLKQQNRVKSIPPPLRHRGKRRMQAWMWGGVVLLALALFFIFFGRDLF